ncbi:protein of unknown function [Kyrpidia spormannii]|uniref:Uncharacterized protein n=1 Tax=Kyrpidia spormannii TaxID=2055160 RepID=A0A6F9E066_9BACL|nr:protein of unknown function [Kyrpidia spormannii]
MIANPWIRRDKTEDGKPVGREEYRREPHREGRTPSRGLRVACGTPCGNAPAPVGREERRRLAAQ